MVKVLPPLNTIDVVKPSFVLIVFKSTVAFDVTLSTVLVTATLVIL